MTIRPYQPSDFQAIVELMREFGDFIEQIDPLSQTAYAEDGAEYFTEKLLSDTKVPGGRLFVATQDDSVIGFIGGYPVQQSEPEKKASQPSRIAVISEFFVSQEFRQAGVGAELLQKLEDHFRIQGCTLLRLEVFAPNQLARHFYAKHGYSERSIVLSKDLSQ